jgi:hypothetical protein
MKTKPTELDSEYAGASADAFIAMLPEHQSLILQGEKTQTFRYKQLPLGVYLMVHPKSKRSLGSLRITDVGGLVRWTTLSPAQQAEQAWREGHGTVKAFEKVCIMLGLHAFIKGEKSAYPHTIESATESAIIVLRSGDMPKAKEAVHAAPTVNLGAFGLAATEYLPEKVSLHPRLHVTKNGEDEVRTQVCDIAVRIPATPDQLKGTEFYAALVAKVNNQPSLPEVEAPEQLSAHPIASIDVDAETKAFAVTMGQDENGELFRVVPTHGIALHAVDVTSRTPPRFLLHMTLKGCPCEAGGWDIMAIPPAIGFVELLPDEAKLVVVAEKGKPGRPKKADNSPKLALDEEEE